MAHAGPLTSQNTVDTRVNTDVSGPGAVRSRAAKERDGRSQNRREPDACGSACIGCLTVYVDLKLMTDCIVQ